MTDTPNPLAALLAGVPTEEDREWIDARADELFRANERIRGSVRPSTIRPQDFRDYFVVNATLERFAVLAALTLPDDEARIRELEAERDEAVRAERQTYRDAVKVCARIERLEEALREIIAREDKAWMPMRLYRTAEQASLDDAAHDAWMEAAQIASAALEEK